MPFFTATLMALTALATRHALAQDPNFDSINRPLKDEKVPVGQAYTVSWTLPSADTPTGPITLTLIGGPSPQLLDPIAAIGHANNADLSFSWTVDASLGAEAVYGLNITLDADASHFQYSNPFQIVGGAAVVSSTTGTGGGATTGPSSATNTGSATTLTGSTTGSAATASTTETNGAASSTTAASNATASSTQSSSSSPSSTTSTARVTSAGGNKTGSAPPASETSGSAAVVARASAALAALAVALVTSMSMGVFGL
ncbi:Cell wall beta-glucan synthesis [Niveomyces insectorum RCEF 264]|uniref:Cell wall beta-glucan synthesis n=1 Tax=Niveomyces insectorum RCEF 264 TaxID=1081102 RepID=A0A167WA87_9HYPO|nr:Cell wall beta-glucan synthesis [Niveomyces insectorum RCEF 264]